MPSDPSLILYKSVIFLVAGLLILPIISMANEKEVYINIRAPQSENDIAHDFFKKLLIKTLNASKSTNEVIKINVNTNLITQKRSIDLLKKNIEIDVDWFGENQERMQELGIVKIPLLDGKLGMRLLVIRREDKQKFDYIRNDKELMSLVACQGSHWPDSDILEYNGYQVLRIAQFETMYKMLRAKRCDYFPRSLTEGYGEVKSIDENGLVAYDKIILAYSFNMLFFTNKKNKTLLDRIERGLLILKTRGELEEFARSHPASRSAFPLSQYKKSIIFTLINPYK